jgi:hypothetical protein
MRKMLFVAALALSFVLTPQAAAGRLLYASDWSGSLEIYAVDPAKKTAPAEITYGLPHACKQLLLACGFRDPLPSPNGRYLLYRGTDDSLWLARADGRSLHELGTTENGADWSRDSRRAAYSGADGIHVVRADGSGDRLLARGLFGDVSWTPDGRALLVYTSNDRLYEIRNGQKTLLSALPQGSPIYRRTALASPDKRWLAIFDVHQPAQLLAIHADTVQTIAVGNTIAAAAWSRDSRSLAAVTPDGLRVYHVRERNSVLITRDTGYVYTPIDNSSPLGVAWVGAGPIAYIRGQIIPFIDGSVSNGNLEVATHSGRIRTLVSASRAFGGRMISLAWAPSPPGLHYRRPAVAPPRKVTATSLLAPGPVSALAADGDRVAFIACQGVYAWTTTTGEVTTAEGPLPDLCTDRINYAFYDVALAGNRLLYASSTGCNSIGQSVRLKLLDEAAAAVPIATGSGSCGGPYYPFVGDLQGGGDLLVFGEWSERVQPGDSTKFVTTHESVLRVGGVGCPCPEVASSPGPLIPADIDAGRIVAYGERATLVLDREGRVQMSVPVAPTAAQLSENDLTVLLPGELRDYDARAGTLLHRWPLPDVPNGRNCWLRCANNPLVLEDADHGLVVYTLNGDLYLLRLVDGADRVLARASLARFMDAGLVYADGSRLWIIPYAKLPLRGF